MTKKTTKKALLMSALSLLLCFSMLIGTTFAWFTDEVKSGVNQIIAGNLDVELYHTDKAATDAKVDSRTKLFDDVTLWEPGALAYEILTVKNEGTLALKYQLSVIFDNATPNGEGKTLADALTVAVVNVDDLATREDAIAAAKANGQSLKTFMLPGTLEGMTANKIDSETYAIVIYWEPTDNDNAYNVKGGLSIELGVKLVATQLNAESDSFGPDYDEDAWHNAMKVYSADDLQDALNNGETKIVLMDDINITAPIVIPAPEVATYSLRETVPNITINLNGMTVNAAYVDGSTTNHVYAFENYGNVVITGNGTINARGIFNYGNMVLENGTINAIDGNGGYAIRNYAGATFTMNGGSIATTLEDDHKVDKGGYDATTVRVDEGATFVMNGGTISNICDFTFAIDNYGTTTVNAGIINSVHSTVSSYGTLTINGGSFTCNGLEGVTAHVLVAWEGSVSNIYGGTFDGKDNYNGFNVDSCEGAVVNIYGGNFLSVHSGSLYGEGTINAYGGTFFDMPANDRIVDGYKAVDNGNGTYTVLFPQESFDELIKNPDENGNVEIPAGTYTFPGAKLNADITLNCAPGTVFEGAKLNANGATIIGATFKNTPSSNTVNGIYKNCTFTGSNGLRYGYAGETVVFENCVFSGSTYGVHFDGGANNVVFKGCTFSGFNAMGAAIKLATYENCTFVANGKSNYNGINMWGNTEMTGCTFVFDGKAGNEWIDLCSAGKYATFTNCVVTDGEKEYGVEEFVSKRENSGVITVDGKQIVHDIYALNYAVEHAESGTVIGFGADITGNVTVVEKNDVMITIDGNGHKFNGILTVNGGSSRNTKNATTIQNIHFYGQTKGTDDAYIKLGGNDGIRYTDNVTVKNCVFDGDNMVAVKSYTGGDWNLTVEDCTVNKGMHSFLQLTNVEQGLKITNCKVYSKNGINLNNTPSLEMTGCTFDVTGYAVRFGVDGNTLVGNFKVLNCTLKSECADNDGVIIYRGTISGTMDQNGTTIEGSTPVKGTFTTVE